MLGRTLLQPAAPITFGLKAAGWLGALTRSWRSCAAAYDHAMVLQFGGAAGTLAALGADGVAVEEALARELGPGSARCAVACASRSARGVGGGKRRLYDDALGKMARDISLLMQHEVGEAFEPGGGSSAMPHKRNPSGCAVVLAAATRMPGLVATMLARACPRTRAGRRRLARGRPGRRGRHPDDRVGACRPWRMWSRRSRSTPRGCAEHRRHSRRHLRRAPGDDASRRKSAARGRRELVRDAVQAAQRSGATFGRRRGGHA